jgi:hypothetical protein
MTDLVQPARDQQLNIKSLMPGNWIEEAPVQKGDQWTKYRPSFAQMQRNSSSRDVRQPVHDRNPEGRQLGIKSMLRQPTVQPRLTHNAYFNDASSRIDKINSACS